MSCHKKIRGRKKNLDKNLASHLSIFCELTNKSALQTPKKIFLANDGDSFRQVFRKTVLVHEIFSEVFMDRQNQRDSMETSAGLDRLREFFRNRIGRGRRFATAREMAQELNLEPSRATILYKFLKGAEPRAGIVLDWLERLGISVMYPEGDCEGVEFVPVLNGCAGAGAYYPITGDDNWDSLRAVDRAMLTRLRVNPDQCYFLDVVGDSMEPLFSDGSTLLIDTSDNARLYPTDGKIYVVRYIDAIMVKRLQLTRDSVTLCSENPMHRPINIPLEDMDRFQVLGRVRWYSVNT